MKAAILRQFGTISVEDLPKPEMGDYDALCELVYGATCTGTDSHIIQGCFPFCSPLPTIFGHESTGRVIAVGKKVRHFKEGDLVTRVGTPPVGGCSITWGGFAEYGIAKDHWAMKADGLPASEWTDKRVNQIIPHGINARVAPMFTTWRETLSYLMRLKVNLPGSRVLIMGSGGNGLAFAAHAANEEAEVTVVGATRLQEQVLSKTRTAHYIDYKHSDLTTRLAEHCPQGFDLIIDAIGKNGLVDTVLPCLKPYGTIAAYGIDDTSRYRSIQPGRRVDSVSVIIPIMMKQKRMMRYANWYVKENWMLHSGMTWNNPGH